MKGIFVIKKDAIQSIKKIFFTVFIQGALGIAAAVINLTLPKFLSVEEYSRWQIYFFYVAYVNFFQFGFNDGLVLNYAGNAFCNLPWRKIKNSTRVIVFYLFLLSILLFGSAFLFPKDQSYIVAMLSFSVIPTVFMCIVSATLLAGNKTYQYNNFNLVIRLLFLLLMLGGICFGMDAAVFYMFADIISKTVISALFVLFYRKQINLGDHADKKETYRFIKENCGSGFTVMLTILILGLLPMCGRIVIQFFGTSIEYAKYSFAVSMMSIILTFTNAVGTVVFPMLKANETNKSERQFSFLSVIYDNVLVFSLLLLGVIKWIVPFFLQEYVSVLSYFPILMAACWPLGKIVSIEYPYYKLYRKEKEFLRIILYGVVFVLVCNIVGYLIYGITGISWATLLGLFCCEIFLEEYLKRKVFCCSIKYRNKKVIIIILFIIFGSYCSTFHFVLLYGMLLMLYGCFLLIKQIFKKKIGEKKY